MEGFCSKHTGETQDVEVLEEEINLCNEMLSELFYLYIWYKLVERKQNNIFYGYFR